MGAKVTNKELVCCFYKEKKLELRLKMSPSVKLDQRIIPIKITVGFSDSNSLDII